jgi:sugar (pentulose or hexulose) kinase
VSADSILVLDAGTSGLRAVLVREGEARTIAREPWRIFTPADGSAFSRELDATEVAASLQRLTDAARDNRDGIAGIAVTGQREGAAFLDAAGAAVCLSPNVDGRAAMEGMTIDARHGGRVYAVTGHLPTLMQAPAKLAWLREHRPDATTGIARVMPLADWLASLITNEQAMSRTLASEIGLVDITNGAVAAPLLDALDLSPSLLPLLVPDGTVVGNASADGLDGLPVALCGADTQCALAAMGVVAAGSAGVVAGWSTPVQVAAQAPVMDAERRIWTGLHVADRRWVLESNAGDCGRAWAWLCETLALDPPAANALAAASPPGSHDALAVVGPPEMRASTMNVLTGGLLFPTPLAISAPGRGDLLRATLESAAYGIRSNLAQIEAIAGARATRIAVGGGMSASPLFTRILADVLARPIHVAASPETSALGAAAVASPAFGLHATIDDAIDEACRCMTVLEPNIRTSAIYDDCYARWRAVAAQLEAGAH